MPEPTQRRKWAVSVTGYLRNRIGEFGYHTGMTADELVMLACRDEVVVGARILEQRNRDGV